MQHRISAGGLVIHEGRILLVRHFRPGIHDFWAPPGGGVEGGEQLEEAAEREVLEETGITARVLRLAYMDELFGAEDRTIKFWFLAEFVSGAVDVTRNPAGDEAISEAGWFAPEALPQGYVFPDPLHGSFWADLAGGFPVPVRLPLKRVLF